MDNTRRGQRVSWLVLALCIQACQPPSQPTPLSPASSSAGPTNPAGPQSAPAATQPALTTIVSVIDPVALQELGARGFSLSELSLGETAKTTAALSKTSLGGIFKEITRDVNATAKAQPPARVTSVDGFRLFDVGWLDSKEMSFALVGIFNRLDRRAFQPETCGEVRFLYRLSFETTQGEESMASRIPLMLNVVFLLPGDDCAKAAQRWRAPQDIQGRALADWLIKQGPLASSERDRWELKSIEVNLQKLRIQSGAHPSLAGHIEYSMFVFHPADEARTRFALAPMENMPDVARLKKDKKLRAELLEYLQRPEVIQEIDLGILNLPERFLATKATSFSPRGLSRIHNRPFKQLFSASDFAGVKLSGLSTIQSEAGLLRRLDGASCVGCHQSRAIAGFHFVGEDAPDEIKGAALWSGLSPHLLNDLKRRRLYVEQVAAKETPDEMRPIPERQGAGDTFGAPCGLGDPGFAGWTCAEGLRCQKLEDDEIGECLPDEAAPSSPCEYGTLQMKAKPHQDIVIKMQRPGCGAKLSCDTNLQGFPLGACSASCSSGLPGLACADFSDIDTLQSCLRKGGAYSACSASSLVEVGVRSCDQGNPCRQDYVCAKTSKQEGACVPPYFIFPLRLDGYPLRR